MDSLRVSYFKCDIKSLKAAFYLSTVILVFSVLFVEYFMSANSKFDGMMPYVCVFGLFTLIPNYLFFLRTDIWDSEFFGFSAVLGSLYLLIIQYFATTIPALIYYQFSSSEFNLYLSLSYFISLTPTIIFLWPILVLTSLCNLASIVIYKNHQVSRASLDR